MSMTADEPILPQEAEKTTESPLSRKLLLACATLTLCICLCLSLLLIVAAGLFVLG